MMELSSWELLDIAGSPRNPCGELHLVWRLLAQERFMAVPAASPVTLPERRDQVIHRIFNLFSTCGSLIVKRTTHSVGMPTQPIVT